MARGPRDYDYRGLYPVADLFYSVSASLFLSLFPRQRLPGARFALFRLCEIVTRYHRRDVHSPGLAEIAARKPRAIFASGRNRRVHDADYDLHINVPLIFCCRPFSARDIVAELFRHRI